MKDYKHILSSLQINTSDYTNSRVFITNRAVDFSEEVLKNAKKSAVSILFYQDQILLMERSEYRGVHSKQISFPGGKCEKGETYLETAIRETQEELGVDLQQIKPINEMPLMYIPPSNFLVKPYIFYLDKKPPLTLETKEVANAWWQSSTQLIQKESEINNYEITNYLGTLRVNGFEANNHFIWGATAILIDSLLQKIYRS